MIKKETIITDDGVTLYRTYSDTEHLIRKVGTDIDYDEAIDLTEVDYEEAEGHIYMDGVETLDEVKAIQKSYESEVAKVSRKINHIGLTDNEALSVAEFYPAWETMIGKTMEKGFITQYNGNLWKSRQEHTPIEVYSPSMDTAALYEVVVYEHEGTIDDPIPYTPPMEIYADKYYTQLGLLYKCTRDSGTALSHDLFDLRGLYVELIER